MRSKTFNFYKENFTLSKFDFSAILALYLNTSLGYSESTATQIYHAFILCCYFTPVIGAWISDGFLGKFRTIFYISIVYAIGQIVLTVGSLGFNDASKAALSFLGLATIAFGTGGIKVRLFCQIFIFRVY